MKYESGNRSFVIQLAIDAAISYELGFIEAHSNCREAHKEAVEESEALVRDFKRLQQANLK